MAVANLNFPRFRAFDANGSPLNGGTVTVYEAGTTTKTTIWNDKDKTAPLSNPVTLDANGEAEIWFEGPVKVVLADSAGNQQWTIDDVPSDIPPSDVGRFNLLENGSFELDSTGDNQPDDWTITEDDATSTVEIDTTNVSHGANSLKFVSQGSGGGTATSTDFFEVNAGKTCVVAFTIKSSVADVRNQVQVRYFNKDQSFISADTVYDENTTNPTSFTEKRFVSSVPATATYAKLRLIGCDPSDPTSGTTYFDDVKVFTDQQAAVHGTGTGTVEFQDSWTFSGTGGNVTVSAADINDVAGVITTEGDLIVGDSNGDESRLVIGSANRILRSDGTTASWGQVVYADLNLSNDLVAGDIAAGAVGQSEVAASAIGQGELKTASGSVTGSDGNNVNRTLPGGQYGFYPQIKVDNAAAGFHISTSTTTSSYTTNVSIDRTLGGSGNADVRQRYFQASPPYDIGDGECGLFVEVDVLSGGVVSSLYVAPDPVWANNGPTNIRPDWIDKATGKKYKRIRRPAITRADVDAGRADMSDYAAAVREAQIDDVEIDFAFKNADMDLIPHSWASPPQGTICLLDPVNTFDLLALHEAGEDIADLIHKGYIKVGDKVNRKGPPGVTPVSWKWRNTKK